MSHREPTFPPELEREIFETTAIFYPGQIPSLIEPLLYKVILFDNTDYTIKHVRALFNKSPELIRMAVRHLALLWSDSDWSEVDMVDIGRLLGLCAGLLDLSLMRNIPRLDPQVLTQWRLQRLQLLFGLADFDLTHTLFTTVTHLTIAGMSEGDFIQNHTLLSELPALTHTTSPACIPSVYDVRFVIGRYIDYYGEWTARARGFAVDDHWSRAADFVAHKRKGEIEETHYWM
ncbi:hypothetical protein C8R46DRAFT_1353989 [Mycena filopes]|nr:hypothetical protein C8R46DRAFT_1353989 [Mycena filopes]